MRMIGTRRQPSLAGRLSLLTGAVITVCLIVLIAAAYRMLIRSVIVEAQDRLTNSTRQLAAVTETSIRQAALQYLAVSHDPALARALEDDDRSTRTRVSERVMADAREALARLMLPSDSGMIVELWNANGRRVAYVGRDKSVATAAASPTSLGSQAILREAVAMVGTSESARLSRLYVADGRAYFWVVQPVIGRRGRIGYIAHERRITGNGQADGSVRALAGEGVSTYYGNVDGSVWSTLGGQPVAPPFASRTGANTAGDSSTQVLTASAAIPGTPLLIMIRSRLDYILEAPRSMLRRLALLGMMLIAAGAAAALLIGRRVTGPIVAVADAAEAIASGQYDTRVPMASEAEIARLAESFNHMAIEVAAAEETRREIAHMGRVATVAEIGASIAHELRQPLTAIRANAEAGLLLLASPRRDFAEASGSFRAIVADCDRAAEVIDDVRRLLRKESGTTIAVDLNGICRQAVHLLRQDAARRRTSLALSLAANPLTIIGDPVQLQQVVLNLTLNALDAASALDRPRQVIVSTSAGAGVAEVAIRDTGPGLPTDVQQRLFQPFFTTKTQGLGMGLAIVRSIVERHHGRIHAEDVSAGGAVFRVTLPVSPPPAVASGLRMISRKPSSLSPAG